MMTDKVSANLWLTSEFDGDIRLEKGRTQKFPSVDFTHLLLETRSVGPCLVESNHLNKTVISQQDSNQV